MKKVIEEELLNSQIKNAQTLKALAERQRDVVEVKVQNNIIKALQKVKESAEDYKLHTNKERKGYKSEIIDSCMDTMRNLKKQYGANPSIDFVVAKVGELKNGK